MCRRGRLMPASIAGLLAILPMSGGADTRVGYAVGTHMSVEPIIVPASEALARLRAGNQRYLQNVRSVDAMLSHRQRGEINLQSPFAIVLGCSDSRAPAEIVFDQG